MPRKQILTNDNIETDIKNIIQRPANPSRVEYNRAMTPLLIFSGIMLAAMVIFQNYYKLILLISLAFIVIYLVVDHFRQKNSVKNVTLNDYEITVETVSHVKEEIYSTDYSNPINRNLKQVHVFVMYFENGKVWNIPNDNYTWSHEYSMSDKTLCQLAHRGDTFTVVTNKATGSIIVAYPSEYFEYKNNESE